MNNKSRIPILAVLLFGHGLMLGMANAKPAQPSPRAGLVVRFGDGTVREFCIALGGTERTGEELLDLAGLAHISEVTALGAKVCRIGPEGCNFPAEACWCKCQDLGAACTYWAYHVLEGDHWVYASLGASARTVHDGDVDGWAWGRGTEGQGAKPPVRTFAQLCPAGDAARTATSPAPPNPSTAAATVRPATTVPPRATPRTPTPRPTASRRSTWVPPEDGGTPQTAAARQAGTAGTPGGRSATEQSPGARATASAAAGAARATGTARAALTAILTMAGGNDADRSVIARTATAVMATLAVLASQETATAAARAGSTVAGSTSAVETGATPSAAERTTEDKDSIAALEPAVRDQPRAGNADGRDRTGSGGSSGPAGLGKGGSGTAGSGTAGPGTAGSGTAGYAAWLLVVAGLAAAAWWLRRRAAM